MDFVDIILTCFAVVYTVSKAFSLAYLRREDSLNRLTEALEVGVHAAWTSVIKPWLNLAGNLKPLPQHIRERAEAVALHKASDHYPAIHAYSKDFLSVRLKDAVEAAKRKGGV